MRVFFILLLLSVHVFCRAQQAPTGPQQDTTATFERGSAAKVIAYDYFFQDTARGIDTSLAAFTRFRPSERQAVPLGFLGPMGSAAYPLIYDPSLQSGAYLGFHQYDAYRKSVENVDYYSTEFPFTDLYYVQGLHGLQLFQAQFGMKVLPQVDIGFDYDIISDNGFLSDRRHRHRGNYFDVHARFQSSNGRYHTLAGYVLNDVKAQEIGGIDTSANGPDELFTGNRSPADALVQLNANSRYSENIFFLHQRYRLGKMEVIDTAGNMQVQANGHELFLDIRYKTQQFNYLDQSPAEEYEQYLLSSDSTRDFTRARIWSPKAGWKYQSADSAKNDWRLAAFGSWDSWQIDQQGRRYTLHDLAANARAHVRLGQGFDLEASGKYHVGDYAFGDWSLEGNLQLQPIRSIELDLQARFKRSTPSFISQHYLSNHFYWEQEDAFDKQTFTSLGGTLEWKSAKLKAGAQWSVTDNLVYFDASATPRQHDPAFSVWKFWIDHQLQWGTFRMDTRAWLQLFPSDAPLNLPTFVSRHRLYFDMEWFEAKVPTNIGVEVYYHSQYAYPSYEQVTGQFLITRNEGRPTYPVIEPYISMKISTARLFFKVTNADQVYPFEDSYYFAKDYPIAPTGFAFGVSWRFFN